MAKPKANSMKKHGILKLKIAVEKLQKSLSLGKKTSSDIEFDSDIEDFEEVNVPNDVKEGHFVVIAADEDGESQRFIVPLSCLTHPTFLGLLEQAAEEYGFDHEGALTIPCRPSDLERILGEPFVYKKDPGVGARWGSTLIKIF